MVYNFQLALWKQNFRKEKLESSFGLKQKGKVEEQDSLYIYVTMASAQNSATMLHQHKNGEESSFVRQNMYMKIQFMYLDLYYHCIFG